MASVALLASRRYPLEVVSAKNSHHDRKATTAALGTK